jgi:hypothetical protein
MNEAANWAGLHSKGFQPARCGGNRKSFTTSRPASVSTPRDVWLFFKTPMIASATCLRIAGSHDLAAVSDGHTQAPSSYWRESFSVSNTWIIPATQHLEPTLSGSSILTRDHLA